MTDEGICKIFGCTNSGVSDLDQYLVNDCCLDAHFAKLSAMNQKIAIVLPSLTDGGAEKVMTLLAGGLAENEKYSVFLVICASRQSGSYYPIPDQVKVVQFDKQHVYQSLFDLVRLFRKESFDLVVTALEHVSLVVSIAIWISCSKAVFLPTVHNTISIKLLQSSKKLDRIVWLFAKWLYKKVPLVGVVSMGVAQDVHETMGIPQKNIRVLYNPVVSMTVHHPQSPIELAPGAIIAIGRLEPEKGFDLLIKAYALIKNDIKNPLFIVGEGSQRKKLEDLVHENQLDSRIHLTGYIADAPLLLSTGHLFVLSSRVEGLPTVLIEALAAGIPIVATDCPSGPREILCDGEYGMLVPVEDPIALAEGIQRQLGAVHDATKNQVRAKDFSIETSVNGYIQVFNELLSREKR